MTVHVCSFRRKGREFYELQWKDPITGRKRTCTTDKVTKREADKLAVKKAMEIEAEENGNLESVTWKSVREAYEKSMFPKQKLKTRQKTTTMFNAIEKMIGPHFAKSLNARQISSFEALLYETKVKPFTVKGYLSELRKVLRWAKRSGYIKTLPEFQLPKVNGMKGRPITREEFDRILNAVPLVLRTKNNLAPVGVVEAWRSLLTGLWFSGLRLSEALELHWTADTGMTIDLGYEYPMIRVRSQVDKAGKDRVLPMAPEFCEMILSVPSQERQGYFFKPTHRSGDDTFRPRCDWVSKIISLCGEKAGVKVAETRRGNSADPKFASAHDLRRAFGFRWAQRVLPPVLQELMRHRDIKTTMEYYAGRHAEVAAKAAFEAINGRVANNFANS